MGTKRIDVRNIPVDLMTARENARGDASLVWRSSNTAKIVMQLTKLSVHILEFTENELGNMRKAANGQ
jgi:hypothetical protein